MAQDDATKVAEAAVTAAENKALNKILAAGGSIAAILLTSLLAYQHVRINQLEKVEVRLTVVESQLAQAPKSERVGILESIVNGQAQQLQRIESKLDQALKANKYEH